jgi:hypothetical protein
MWAIRERICGTQGVWEHPKHYTNQCGFLRRDGSGQARGCTWRTTACEGIHGDADHPRPGVRFHQAWGTKRALLGLARGSRQCALDPGALAHQQGVAARLRGAIPIDVQIERCPVEPELGRDRGGIGRAIRQGGHDDPQRGRRHFAGATPMAALGGCNGLHARVKTPA